MGVPYFLGIFNIIPCFNTEISCNFGMFIYLFIRIKNRFRILRLLQKRLVVEVIINCSKDFFQEIVVNIQNIIMRLLI